MENISQSRKKIQNREKYFKLEKNVSESRNILLQESRKKIEFNDFEFNKHNIKECRVLHFQNFVALISKL